jgi:hypothetical protein
VSSPWLYYICFCVFFVVVFVGRRSSVVGAGLEEINHEVI